MNMNTREWAAVKNCAANAAHGVPAVGLRAEALLQRFLIATRRPAKFSAALKFIPKTFSFPLRPL
jgi:hypothetical protein